MKLTSLVIVVLAFGIGSLSEARTWTDASGTRSIEAEFIKRDGENVVLRMPNGTISQFSIARLSEQDQNFVKQQPAGAPAPATSTKTPPAKPAESTSTGAKGDARKQILGTWEGYMADSDGSRHGDIRLEITEDKITATNPQGGREMGAGTFKINGRKIDATGTEGQFSGRKYEGIIDLDGKTLKWCSANDNPRSKRPDKFQTDTQAGQFLMVLEKK